ncbi:MAG: methyltransferase [Hyphomicrobiales bacterium]|nr:methyltransferase [Hyphomicrobiales bacterium]
MEFENIYGVPDAALVETAAGARQFSPLSPGALSLADAPAGSLNGLAMLAPPGTVERRYAIALALRALAPGAPLVVMAPKDKGGSRISSDLALLGCESQESSRRHHRICVATGPGDAQAIAAAVEEGAPKFLDDLQMWSQPGVFSWNRVDPGSAMLLEHLAPMNGKGADLGCGIGVLARAVLASPKVSQLTMVDIDGRAVEMARRNVTDPRANIVWADARSAPALSGLDFVVMNPPFHEGGLENQSLGQTFIQRAASILRPYGNCWLTANRHLPYETILKPLFKKVTLVAETGGYKIFQAQK